MLRPRSAPLPRPGSPRASALVRRDWTTHAFGLLIAQTREARRSTPRQSSTAGRRCRIGETRLAGCQLIISRVATPTRARLDARARSSSELDPCPIRLGREPRSRHRFGPRSPRYAGWGVVPTRGPLPSSSSSRASRARIPLHSVSNRLTSAPWGRLFLEASSRSCRRNQGSIVGPAAGPSSTSATPRRRHPPSSRSKRSAPGRDRFECSSPSGPHVFSVSSARERHRLRERLL